MNNTSKSKIDRHAFIKPGRHHEDLENYNKTLFLAIFLGVFGAHRFYNRKKVTGVLMLITLGGGLIWAITDVYLIMNKKFKNAEGKTLSYRGEFYENPVHILVIGFCLMLLGLWVGSKGVWIYL